MTGKARASRACLAMRTILNDGWPPCRATHLRPDGAARIVKAYDPALVDKEAREYMDGELEFYVRPPKPVDLELAGAVLLDLNASICREGAGNKSSDLIQSVVYRPDRKLIPLLVSILKKFNPVHQRQSFDLVQAVDAHATLFPNAMRNELDPPGRYI